MINSVRRIGQFQVSLIGLGAMPLSFGRAEIPAEEQAIATVHAALDAGITMIDTADIYAPTWDTMGHNEKLVAKALAAYGGDTTGVVVATKGGITRADGEQWGRDGSPAYLRRALERSLEALERDVIDLYYWHRPDRSLVYASTIEALAELKREGLIKEIGISNANVEEIRVAMDVLGDGGLAAVQNEFSLRFNHTSKQELDLCGEHGVAFVPYSPLGGSSHAKMLHDRFRSVVDIAEDRGVSAQQVVLAWALALGKHVVPIPGASRPESVIDSARAMHLELKPAEVDRINREAL